MSANNRQDDEEAILQLLEEERMGDIQRANDEIMSFGTVRFIDPATATVDFYWLGFFGERSTIQSDKTIWTARKNNRGDWELDDWDGFNDVVSFDVTTENVPWDQLLKVFHFASPQEMAEELVMHPHFENQVIELMANLPAETPSSHVVRDPILRKAMAHFDV